MWWGRDARPRFELSILNFQNLNFGNLNFQNLNFQILNFQNVNFQILNPQDLSWDNLAVGYANSLKAARLDNSHFGNGDLLTLRGKHIRVPPWVQRGPDSKTRLWHRVPLHRRG